MTTPDLIAELAEVVRLQRLVDATYGCECENAMEDRDNAAVNFLRTHAAEIEAMARDARALRHAVTKRVELEVTEDGEHVGIIPFPSSAVGRQYKLVRIDKAMRDGAREGGNE